jgi:hypothetical protein
MELDLQAAIDQLERAEEAAGIASERARSLALVGDDPGRVPQPRALDQEAVARSLALQIMRIKVSALRHLLTNEQARDVSPLLSTPLYAVAADLDLTEQVCRHIDAAMMRARSILDTR